MKQWLGKFLLEAFNSAQKESSFLVTAPPSQVVGSHSNEVDNDDGMIRFAIIKAANGRILKVSKYKPNPRGPDWTHELHIIPEQERVADAVTRVLAIHSLES